MVEDGFDWTDLNPGSFSSYGGLDFSGFICKDPAGDNDLVSQFIVCSVFYVNLGRANTSRENSPRATLLLKSPVPANGRMNSPSPTST